MTNGRNAKGKQTYRCKRCSKRFLHAGQVGGRRATADQIGTAIRMYYGGTSYKQTGETLTEAYDIPEPSKRALYEWVPEYTAVAKDILADHPAHTSGKWVADEIQVRVGGEKYWLWNVMDANTRHALAVHLSPNRDHRSLAAVLFSLKYAATLGRDGLSVNEFVRRSGTPNFAPMINIGRRLADYVVLKEGPA